MASVSTSGKRHQGVVLDRAETRLMPSEFQGRKKIFMPVRCAAARRILPLHGRQPSACIGPRAAAPGATVFRMQAAFIPQR